MAATVSDVLENRAPWACVQGDCIEWLRSLPDDSIDLLFTSPPYLEARTYGADLGKPIDEWVPWMVELVRVAAPKVKGLIAINCEGQTRKYRYLPGPFLLMADLYRAGFTLRKPVVFHRVGVPGGGGNRAQRPGPGQGRYRGTREGGVHRAAYQVPSGLSETSTKQTEGRDADRSGDGG